MTKPLTLHPDRLFPADPATRAIARALYEPVAGLPIISPHGHTDPAWFADDAPFANAAELLLAPDHYLFRMLYSQGVPLERWACRARGGRAEPTRARPGGCSPSISTCSAARRRGSGWTMCSPRCSASTCALDGDDRRPLLRPHRRGAGSRRRSGRAPVRPLQDRALATTEGAARCARPHEAIRASGWQGRVVTAYRPDPVVDPEHEDFAAELERFGELTGEDVASWAGYLARPPHPPRAFFREAGATSTDHGHPTARTARPVAAEAEALFAGSLAGSRRRRTPSCSAPRC